MRPTKGRAAGGLGQWAWPERVNKATQDNSRGAGRKEKRCLLPCRLDETRQEEERRRKEAEEAARRKKQEESSDEVRRPY